MQRLLALMTLIVLLTGCTPPVHTSNKTSLELQAIQSREFSAEKKVVFASVLSVYQDLGYSISASDINTGFITAKSPTQHQMGFGKTIMKDSRTTAFIEDLTPGKTKVRLNFINAEEWSGAYGAKLLQENPVEDAAIYNNAFVKIQEGIFIRSNKN